MTRIGASLAIALLAWALVGCGDDGGTGDDSGMVVDSGSDTGAPPTDTGVPTDSGTADGGDTGSPADSGAADNRARWMAVCDTLDAMMCGLPDGMCARRADCYDPWLDADVFAEYIACFEAGGCMASDDPCIGSVTVGLTPSAEASALADTCRMKEDECGGFPGDPICIPEFYAAIQDSYFPAYEACFAGPCDDVVTCMRATRPAACNGG